MSVKSYDVEQRLNAHIASGVSGPFAVAQGNANSQTTTQTITWTPPAAITHFRVSVWIRLQSGTSVAAQLAFTEFSGTADSFTLPMLKMDSATTTPTFTINTTTNLYHYSGTFTTSAAAVNVVLTITPTSATFRYSYYIEQLP